MWFVAWTCSPAGAATWEVPADGTFAEVVEASGDGDVILLPGGTIAKGIPSSLDVRLTIRGAPDGGTVLVLPDQSTYAIDVHADTVLEDLTLDGGGYTGILQLHGVALTTTRVSFVDGEADGAYGAAIRVEAGSSLTCVDTVFRGHSAREGGALDLQVGAELTCVRCVFEDNRASAYEGRGGAIWAARATLDLVDTTFVGNRSTQASGGAIAVTDGSSLTVTAGAFADNEAEGHGGHVMIVDGSATFTDVRLEGGRAGLDGGGIAKTEGELTLTRVVLCNNRADRAGGAVWARGGIHATNVAGLWNEAGTTGGAVDADLGRIGFATWYANQAPEGAAVTGGTALDAAVIVAHDRTENGAAVAGTVVVTDAVTWGNRRDFDPTVTVVSAVAAAGPPFDPPPDTCAVPIPAWEGDLVDRVDGVADPDGSPADVGATGGPDADRSLWADQDGDGVVAMWDCDDLDPTLFPPGCTPAGPGNGLPDPGAPSGPRDFAGPWRLGSGSLGCGCGGGSAAGAWSVAVAGIVVRRRRSPDRRRSRRTGSAS